MRTIWVQSNFSVLVVHDIDCLSVAGLLNVLAIEGHRILKCTALTHTESIYSYVCYSLSGCQQSHIVEIVQIIRRA